MEMRLFRGHEFVPEETNFAVVRCNRDFDYVQFALRGRVVGDTFSLPARLEVATWQGEGGDSIHTTLMCDAVDGLVLSLRLTEGEKEEFLEQAMHVLLEE